MIRIGVGRRLSALLLPALSIGLLALAACATSTSTQTQPTPTPSAQEIVQRASAVTINDAAFTFSGTETSGSVTGNLSGSAEFTTSPARLEMQVTVPYSGTSISASFIVDTPTSTIYIKFGANSLGIPSNVWYKGSASGTLGSFSGVGSQISSCTAFKNITNPTLVGSDTINGVAVWHIHGKDTCGGSSATVDVDFRQDNYYPVKAVIVGGGSNVTINFTSVNTGLTIALPTNAQPFP